MTGRWRALLRLYAVQATWNYERMLGVGMGYAAEPLLEDLKAVDPVRHGEAVVRSAEFFNANPNLAGLALGATVRGEYEAVPAPQLDRLRTALCSPLGALGDQLFWTGLVPSLVGLALIAAALGAGLWPVIGLLIVYNAIRFGTALWSLRTGLECGMRVAHALVGSWVPRTIRLVEPLAGLTVGAAVPLVARWYLEGQAAVPVASTLAVAVVGVVLTRWSRLQLGGARFGLLAILVALLLLRAGL